jgi:hypothetical protein
MEEQKQKEEKRYLVKLLGALQGPARFRRIGQGASWVRRRPPAPMKSSYLDLVRLHEAGFYRVRLVASRLHIKQGGGFCIDFRLISISSIMMAF